MAEERRDITIRISQLSNGIHEYHFSSEPSDLGLDTNFQHTVEIDTVLEKSNRQLFLRAKVNTNGIFHCDRCTEEFEQSLASEHVMFYVYNAVDSDNFEDEDVRMITLETPYLNITDDIRQTVMLSVPLKLVCKEDCRGLCPRCGTDWNRQTCSCTHNEADPRWDSLKKLLNN